MGVFTGAFDLGVAVGAILGGFSEYLGFTGMYLLVAFVPLMGLILFKSQAKMTANPD